MPNLLTALREEIRKQARKEVRASLDRTKKSVTTHRREIAELKKQLAAAQKRIAFLEDRERKRIENSTANTTKTDSIRRFSAKSVRAHRERLGLSATEYGLLLGVSAQVVYKWEKGRGRPQKGQLSALAELRSAGKKEVRERLRLIKQAEKP